MLLYRNAGLAPATPASAAPPRVVLIVLLLGAVALRRVDWWKLLDHVPRLLARGRPTFIAAAALGATLSGAEDAEELASDDAWSIRDAIKRVAFRVVLEVATFYGLLAAARVCGLLAAGDGDSDALAYLADAFAGGWGESIALGVVWACFVAAREMTRGRPARGTTGNAMTRATPDPPRRSGVACVIATNTA